MGPLICAKCGTSWLGECWACAEDHLTPQPTHGILEYTMSTVSDASGVECHAPGAPFAHAPLNQITCEVCNAEILGECWSCMDVGMGDFSPPRSHGRDISDRTQAPNAAAINTATLDQCSLQVAGGDEYGTTHSGDAEGPETRRTDHRKRQTYLRESWMRYYYFSPKYFVSGMDKPRPLSKRMKTSPASKSRRISYT